MQALLPPQCTQHTPLLQVWPAEVSKGAVMMLVMINYAVQ
jgi:hypothetical protein